MSSVETAVSDTPEKNEKPTPGTKSRSYGKMPALHVICMASPPNCANCTSSRARICSKDMPECTALRYTWYRTMARGRGRFTHCSCASMIA